jgi:hypothetical protein
VSESGRVARWFGAPLRLWRGRAWWVVALVAFLLPLALVALLILTPPIVPDFAYTLR